MPGSSYLVDTNILLDPSLGRSLLNGTTAGVLATDDCAFYATLASRSPSGGWLGPAIQ